MKVKKIIALFFHIFFLTGLALTGFSQGKVENNGGYLKSSSTNYFKFSGSGDMTLKSTNADRTTFGNMEAAIADTANIPDAATLIFKTGSENTFSAGSIILDFPVTLKGRDVIIKKE